MDGKLKRQLELQAYKMRKLALQTIETAGSGHIGGSFSIAEILSVLYFDEMNVDVNEPKKIDRDRLVLSKGHCSSLYTALAMKGFFKPEHLATFRKIDSDLSGHVEIHVPGVDMSGDRWDRDCQLHLAWLCMDKAENWDIAYSVLWETVKFRKARSGKRPWRLDFTGRII